MDIQLILQEIRKKGFSDNAIAKAITLRGHRISQPVIFRLRNGINKRTFYDRHEAIKNFYNSIKNQE